MSPQADPASSVLAQVHVPEHLLNEGEIIILAIKPSGWFVLLKSAPVLGAVAIVAAGFNFLDYASQMPLNINAINFVCLLFALGRLVLASCQWIGSLYVLTDRRVISVHAAVRVSIEGVMLKDISATCLTQSAGEKLTSVATLVFENKKGEIEHCKWYHLANSREVHQVVNRAIKNT